MGRPDPFRSFRCRLAVYAAIVAALRTGHPRRFAVARALDRLVTGGTDAR